MRIEISDFVMRTFVLENGREPMQKDVLYDRELKARFGSWTRMLEKAGTRPVSQRHIDKLERRRKKRIRQKKLRKEKREAKNTTRGVVSIDEMPSKPAGCLGKG